MGWEIKLKITVPDCTVSDEDRALTSKDYAYIIHIQSFNPCMELFWNSFFKECIKSFFLRHLFSKEGRSHGKQFFMLGLGKCMLVDAAGEFSRILSFCFCFHNNVWFFQISPYRLLLKFFFVTSVTTENIPDLS